MHQEKPILTNEEILALIDVCNELCVAIETHNISYQSVRDYPWQFLMARKNSLWNSLIKFNLRKLSV